ncbi:MAG: ribonuclease E/G [Rhodovarius sp.]|nr:ribonuclease E/G [Rhodovarius sp.]
MAQALILLSRSPGERRVALLLDGVLTEAWVERPARPDGVGDVWAGRVAALAPAMAGAFIALPDGSTGFLPESEASRDRRPLKDALQEGQLVVAVVTRAAQGGKGPRLSVRRAPPLTASAPGLLARGPDAAQRLRAAHPDARILADDRAEARRLGAEYVPRAFDAELEAAFEALAEPRVELPGGGLLWIEETRALTALDLDAGAHAGAGRDAQRRFNESALSEVARQIRLRQLGGPILLDVAGLSPRDRQQLLPALSRALAADSLAELLGIGPLGLFEIRRARVHPPLSAVLAGPLTPALALLRQAAREAAAAPHRRLVLRAPAAWLEALRNLPGALEEYAAAAGHPLLLEEADAPAIIDR